jgi:hypothetical protein
LVRLLESACFMLPPPEEHKKSRPQADAKGPKNYLDVKILGGVAIFRGRARLMDGLADRVEELKTFRTSRLLLWLLQLPQAAQLRQNESLSPYQRPQPTPDRPDASNPPLFAHLLIAVAVTPTLPACLDELSSVPLQDHQKDGKNTKGSTATRASKTFDGNPPDMNLLRLAGRDDDAPPIPTPTNCVAAAARATRPPTSPPAPFRCPE